MYQSIVLNVGSNPKTNEVVALDRDHLNALIVGSVGSGKSTLVHNIVHGICAACDPADIDLRLIDGKGAEFGAYADEYGTSLLPHVSELVASANPHVLLSALYSLESEIRRRSNLFRKRGVNSIEEYNSEYGRCEGKLPRVVMILEEFPALFTDTLQADMEKFLQYVHKHQMRCGCHIIFTASSPSKVGWHTVLSMCSVRIALRSPSKLSTEVLGSAVAAELKDKYGFCYTNTESGASPMSTTLWQTPSGFTVEDIRANCATYSREGARRTFLLV